MKNKLLKDRMSSSLGSMLEWYDFSLYGFFAPILAQIFFPNRLPSIALLQTFAVFAIGFAARPVGALIFGYISDKHGRAICLKLTPLFITIPTFILAILPSYQHIGLLAPIALIVLRIFQGLCIGGEYANNIVYLCETTRSKNIYFLGRPGTRCTILSFTVNFCFGTLGGAVPFIGFLLVTTLQSKIAPVYYLIFAGLITLIATLLFERRKGFHEKSARLCANIN